MRASARSAPGQPRRALPQLFAEGWARWAAPAGYLVLAVVVVVDVLTPDVAVFLGLTVLGPLIASLGADVRSTALVSLLALAAAILLGLPNGIFLSTDHVIRLGTLTGTAALAVYVAVERSQRRDAHRRLAHVAEIAQEVMLRPPPKALGHIGLAARYRSASDESLIGGDLYETAYTPYGVRLIIGDVRGKGLNGIRLAATVLGTFREAMWDRDLGELVHLIDERVTAEAGDEDFVTAVVVEFPPEGGVLLVNCGHHAPVRLRDDDVELLEPMVPSLPLGLGPSPRVDRFELAPGDRLMLCTDGLLEARDSSGAFFPYLDHLDVLKMPDLQDSVDALVERVLDHLPGSLEDDLAIVLAMCLPRPVERSTAAAAASPDPLIP